VDALMNGDLDLSLVPGYELLRPLCTGWTALLEVAKRAKSEWQEIADECLMFYSKSSAAMWKPEYARKFWRGIKPPRFQISINRIFEAVAIFAPNLMFDVPHRTVEPKRALELPPDFMQFVQQDQQLMQMMQVIGPQQQQSEITDQLVARLLQTWLNYTPREQPKGGLIGQSELAIVDALIKGRGIMATRPYRMPQSDQVLTGSFRIAPEDLLIDPDFRSLDDAKWIALKHIDTHWSLERRFKLPANSLKGRASLESSWHYGTTGSEYRTGGESNDLVCWFEIWSKTGCGARLSGMHMPIKEHLEKVVGDYAYLAIAPAVPFPLNLYSQDLRTGGAGATGLSNDEVKTKLSWPVPTYGDDRWPLEVLDFYPDTESSWPVAPMAPGLGELKFLNFLIPWACNRAYSTSRDFLAVAGAHADHYTKYLEEGNDLSVIPTPIGVADVRAVMQVLQFPAMNMDVWKLIEMVGNLFDRRVGLTESAYGMNEGGTQSRSAEDVIQKQRAVGIRPDHMRRKVVQWQSALSCLEAFCARWFVQGKDVLPLMGPLGQFLWERFVMSTDVQLVTREMAYTVSTASIRRPDRDRDVANLTQLIGLVGPVLQAHMQQTGDVTGYNALVSQWGEYHDMRVDQFALPPPPPPQPPQPTPQDQVNLAVAQLELQGKQIDVQGKMAAEQAKAQASQVKSQSAIEAARLKLMLSQAAGTQQLQQSAQSGQLAVAQKAMAGQQDLRHNLLSNELDLVHQLEMARIKQAQARQPKANGKA
jgi:hypothetical protein